MKTTLNESWYWRMAELEGDLEVGAGAIALDPIAYSSEQPAVSSDKGRRALGQFVKLMRRKRQISIETLASEVDVDLSELMKVETDLSGLPGPRTLHNIAEYFDVSYDKLMGLSGLMQPKDRNYLEESVRFAARSEIPEALSPVEQEISEQWLSVLSEKHG